MIADSEALANGVLAETLTALGRPTTLEDSLQRYCGRRWSEAMAEIEADLGRPAPEGFSEALRAATFARFRSELREVQGATAFIHRFRDTPRCIASSSSHERLALCLDALGLTPLFEGHVVSADEVARGKPHPDVFLLAAARLGIAPADCLVIEDSDTGVRAAVAAGMAAVGLCAASHIRDGHGERLSRAGATHLVAAWSDVDHIAHAFIAARA